MAKTGTTASVRNGVAAIIFRKSKRGIEFLATHRIKRWKGWETLKGGSERGESKKQTLIREMKEELDLNKNELRALEIIPEAKISFRIPQRFRRQMGGFSRALYKPFYLVEISPRAKLDLRKDETREHDRIRLVPYSEALKLLTYGNVRAALRKAKKMITE